LGVEILSCQKIPLGQLGERRRGSSLTGWLPVLVRRREHDWGTYRGVLRGRGRGRVKKGKVMNSRILSGGFRGNWHRKGGERTWSESEKRKEPRSVWKLC